MKLKTIWSGDIIKNKENS